MTLGGNVPKKKAKLKTWRSTRNPVVNKGVIGGNEFG